MNRELIDTAIVLLCCCIALYFSMRFYAKAKEKNIM